MRKWLFFEEGTKGSWWYTIKIVQLREEANQEEEGGIYLQVYSKVLVAVRKRKGIEVEEYKGN